MQESVGSEYRIRVLVNGVTPQVRNSPAGLLYDYSQRRDVPNTDCRLNHGICPTGSQQVIHVAITESSRSMHIVCKVEQVRQYAFFVEILEPAMANHRLIKLTNIRNIYPSIIQKRATLLLGAKQFAHCGGVGNP